MKIKNVSDKKIVFSDLYMPGTQQNLELGSLEEVLIYDEDAEKSAGLKVTMAAGKVTKLSNEEPNDSGDNADIDVSEIAGDISALETAVGTLEGDTHTHANMTTLDGVEVAFTTALETKVNDSVSLTDVKADTDIANAISLAHDGSGDLTMVAVKAETDIASAISLKHDASTQALKDTLAVSPDAANAAGATPTDLEFNAVVALVNELKGIVNAMNA